MPTNYTLITLWHAGLTALAISLVSGLFLLGLPQFYKATAVVAGEAGDALIVKSATVLEPVLDTQRVDQKYLEGWQEMWLGRRTDRLNLLKRNMEVSTASNDNWLEISVSTRTPQLSADIVNGIAEAYMEELRWLSVTPEARARLADQVSEIEKEQLSFLEAHPEIRDPGTERRQLQSQLNRLKAEQGKQAVRAESLRESLSLMEAGQLTLVKGQARLAQVVRQRDQLILQQAELSARYGSEHQKIKTISARLAAADLLVTEEAEKVRLGLQQDIEKAVLAGDEVLARLEQVQSVLKNLDRLNLEWEALGQRHAEAVRHLENGSMSDLDFRFSKAIPPDHAVGYGLVESVLLVFLVSFAGAIALISLRPSREKSPDEPR